MEPVVSQQTLPAQKFRHRHSGLLFVDCDADICSRHLTVHSDYTAFGLTGMRFCQKRSEARLQYDVKHQPLSWLHLLSDTTRAQSIAETGKSCLSSPGGNPWRATLPVRPHDRLNKNPVGCLDNIPKPPLLVAGLDVRPRRLVGIVLSAPPV